MFQRTVPHVRLSYAIDGQLIAIGNTTWQTKNLTSVSVERAKLAVAIPAPFFRQDQPKRKLYVGWLLLSVAVAWTLSLWFERPTLIGVPATVLACLATVAFVRHSHRNRLNLWNLSREKSAQQKSVWRGLGEKPVEIFSLVFQSSSGESVALRTFDGSSVNAVHAAILEAMRSTKSTPLQRTIEAIEPSANDVDKMYETFCSEEVASA